jgi:hypothetical protein
MANHLFEVCPTFAGINQAGAERVSQWIQTSPSVPEFEAFVRAMPQYQLRYGDSRGMPALCAIFYHRVFRLIPGIIARNPQLINHGDFCGLTSLFYALIYNKEHRCILQAHRLICRGAKLNISTFSDCLHKTSMIPSGATPLWVACEMWGPSRALIVFLLKQGARLNMRDGQVFPKLSSNGELGLCLARMEMTEQAQAYHKKQEKLRRLFQKKATYLRLLPDGIPQLVIKLLEPDFQEKYALKELTRVAEYYS